MNNFILFSIEAAICLSLFYMVYRLFLKQETFFKLNRFYLLLSAASSLALPTLNISGSYSFFENSMLGKYLMIPVENLKQHFNENAYNSAFSKSANRAFSHRNDSQNMTNAVTAISLPALSTADENTKLQSAFPEYNTSETISLFKVVMIVYFTGVAFFTSRLLFLLSWLLACRLRNTYQRREGRKVVRLKRKLSPFSFVNVIFINDTEYTEEEYHKIIAHEKIHIRQWHSVDLLVMEFIFILQWFNPVAWFYKHALKITHEFLADQGVLNAGVEIQEYQYSLINQAFRINNMEVVSSYNYSVKERIAMMMKKRSPKRSVLKYTFVTPVMLVLFAAFAINCNRSANAGPQQSPLEGQFNDTTIKRKSVTLEYLKLIEGEYVSTNDPYGTRRIIFSELLGDLYGYDNGYVYKIIPLGDGNFINPQDKATLFFDTNDKNEITLLLFGKINLKKVKAKRDSHGNPNKSLAYTTANVMTKKGVEPGLTFFDLSKDSSNYYLIENEMNFAGYELLQKGLKKEAAALFKINTGQFPNSFNTYDSYAEALLALGKKEEAIENYKKSLKLNPGSKSGRKQLKELGVNPDDVVKIEKLPMDYLKLLEGVYVSSNQPKWIRRITLIIEEGELKGEDNGYHYSLIPMGKGRFINPDDGVSLVFDTKDPSKISFLIFGKTTMVKVNKSDVPEAPLYKYAGVYYPADKDTILRPMEIMNSQYKLFRFIEEAHETTNRTVELQFIKGNLFYYSDQSARSIEFILNDQKEVTSCLLRRMDGTYRLDKR